MRKVLSIFLILPAFAFCDYKMHETKEGVFIVNEQSGKVYRYKKYKQDRYETNEGIEAVHYHLHETDEGVRGCASPSSDFFTIESKK